MQFFTPTLATAALTFAAFACPAVASDSLLQVDARALVTRADLIYLAPTAHNREGQPIGNGRMGTVVWTTPGAVHFLINRVDQYAADNSHCGQFCGPSDDFGRLVRVSIEVGGEPFAPAKEFVQRLSLYNAECTIRGQGVAVRCFISSERDVLALEIDDTRAAPPPLKVTVTAVRPLEVRTGEHLARVEFPAVGKDVALLQRFDEKDYHCSGAVVARIVDEATSLTPVEGSARSMTAPGKVGKRLVLLASAGAWAPDAAKTTEQAARLLAETAAQSYDALRAAHFRWWHSFWARTFVHLTSADGSADYLERIRNVHLYLMGCISRGPVITAMNTGTLFRSDANKSHWGGQHWLWNTASEYYALFAADALDLMEPYFGMYRRWLPNCEAAARQRWGCAGAFYPETAPFNGPKVLPEDVAKEFQDVMLGRKPNTELSDAARAACSYCAQAAVFARPGGKLAAGRYTWISHYATDTLDLGQQFWWRYRYSGDLEWMRENAYPILRGGMEFYRSLAGEKGKDGCYHIYPTNARESFWGVRDSITDLAVIRGAGPLAIRAAELLGVDAELREKWREFIAHLAPYPMGSEPEAQALAGGVKSADTWAAARKGDVAGCHNGEDVWAAPIFPYEHVTLATKDQVLRDVAWRTHRAMQFEGSSWHRDPVRTARIGDVERLPGSLFSRCATLNPSGFQDVRGAEDYVSIEALSLTSAAVQDGLLQAVSPQPGEPEVLIVFPTWPKQWNGSYRLLARGGFLVASTIQDGKIGFVEIASRLGETCRLRNPWKGPCLLTEDGGAEREIPGELLEFATRQGARYLVRAAGQAPPQTVRIAVPEQTAPATLRFAARPGGGEYRARLGKPRVPLAAPVASLLRPGASATAEVPRAGLRLWLRSDKGVTETEGRVSQWQDQSGNGYHAAADGPARPSLLKDAAHLGRPAIRFDGQRTQLAGKRGLGMDMPGPFTLVVVTTLSGGWPKAIFSLVPADRGADFVSAQGFALACSHGTPPGFALTQGYQGIGLNLVIDNEQGKPQTITVVRPVRMGAWVAGYRNGTLKAQAAVTDDEPSHRQDTGYLIGSRWPPRSDLFGACDLYEFLLYDRVLSEAELQSLHQYLRVPRTP
jgi:hypothetical protein